MILGYIKIKSTPLYVFKLLFVWPFLVDFPSVTHTQCRYLDEILFVSVNICYELHGKNKQ